MRCCISRAALLVKVTARISDGHARRVKMMCARRLVSARVLPVPAPARSSTGPSVVSTASRWAGLSPRHVDMVVGQVADEARWDRRRPLAVDAAVGGVADRGGALGPRDADIGEPALLLEAGVAALVERALRREDAFLPADEEDVVELEPLGGVEGHDRHALLVARALVFHDEADVVEEGGHRLRTPPSRGSAR